MSNTGTKNRFFNVAIATLMAATIAGSALVASPAEAGKRERYIGAGILAGVIGTAIVARERRHRREIRRYRRSSWERHVNRCYRRYRSYDEGTDTWIDRYGRERRCRL